MGPETHQAATTATTLFLILQPQTPTAKVERISGPPSQQTRAVLQAAAHLRVQQRLELQTKVQAAAQQVMATTAALVTQALGLVAAVAALAQRARLGLELLEATGPLGAQTAYLAAPLPTLAVVVAREQRLGTAGAVAVAKETM